MTQSPTRQVGCFLGLQQKVNSQLNLAKATVQMRKAKAQSGTKCPLLLSVFLVFFLLARSARFADLDCEIIVSSSLRIYHFVYVSVVQILYVHAFMLTCSHSCKSLLQIAIQLSHLLYIRRPFWQAWFGKSFYKRLRNSRGFHANFEGILAKGICFHCISGRRAYSGIMPQPPR